MPRVSWFAYRVLPWLVVAHLTASTIIAYRHQGGWWAGLDELKAAPTRSLTDLISASSPFVLAMCTVVLALIFGCSAWTDSVEEARRQVTERAQAMADMERNGKQQLAEQRYR